MRCTPLADTQRKYSRPESFLNSVLMYSDYMRILYKSYSISVDFILIYYKKNKNIKGIL